MAPSARLRAALAAIDDANAADPTVVTVRDRTGPKEIIHADLVTEWVLRLRPDADEALLLAARGHHFRRWTVPRSSYPAGRAAYLRWRKDLHAQHATIMFDHEVVRGGVSPGFGNHYAVFGGSGHEAEFDPLSA